MSIQDLYDQAVGQVVGEEPDLETTRMFGSPGLKTRGKTFAMIVKGELVVNCPANESTNWSMLATGSGSTPATAAS